MSFGMTVLPATPTLGDPEPVFLPALSGMIAQSVWGKTPVFLTVP